MSYVWEITDEDIRDIYVAHSLSLSPSRYSTFLRKAKNLIKKNYRRIEKAVCYYTDFEKQSEVAFSEVEDILMENNLLPKKKKF